MKSRAVADPNEKPVEREDLEITPETLEDDETPLEAVQDEGIELPFGGDLSQEQLRALQLARPVQTIALFGEHRSGKTTLVSEIYHAFCGGPFAEHIFAESRTIAGFERRLHPSRLASGRSTEDMGRTSSNKNLTYLHLRLLAGGTRAVDLAWADRAGEDFRALAGATEPSDIPYELGASRHLAFLIDGAKLAEASERANAIQRARQSLQKLIDLGVVGKSHDICFVTTKVDRIQSPEVKIRADAALGQLQESCKRHRSEVASLSFFETSVRKEAGSDIQLLIPHGLDLLLKHWTAETKVPEAQVVQPKLRRQMDQLLHRVPNGGPIHGK